MGDGGVERRAGCRGSLACHKLQAKQEDSAEAAGVDRRLGLRGLRAGYREEGEGWWTGMVAGPEDGGGEPGR